MEIVLQLEIADVIFRRERSDDRKYVSSSQAKSKAPFNSGALRAKRACGAPWVNKSTHPRKFGNHVTDRPTVRPHHRHTNVYSHTFYLRWEPRRKLIAHQCCHQSTAVKTGYPLTSITWPYRGLRCRPIKVECFLKLSADNLLVFK